MNSRTAIVLKDVSFVENDRGDEEEVVFRQDAAWNKSVKRNTREKQALITVPSPVKSNFNSDLEKTIKWMKNTRQVSEKLVINLSERSKGYEAYFPTFTPSFLGDAIADQDLEKVLLEFQSSPIKKKKKKKKSKKNIQGTLSKTESEATLFPETEDYSLDTLSGKDEVGISHQESIQECNGNYDKNEFWAVLNPFLPTILIWSVIEFVLEINLKMISFFGACTGVKWDNSQKQESSLVFNLKSLENKRLDEIKTNLSDFIAGLMTQRGLEKGLGQEYVKIMREEPEILTLGSECRVNNSKETSSRLHALLLASSSSSIVLF